MTNLDISKAVPGLLKTPSAHSIRPGQYVNPSSIQNMLKVFDAVCAFVTFTGLFFYSLRFLSDDAALVAGMVLAAEATYVCYFSLRWIRIYDIDVLANPIRGVAASLSLITIVGIAVIWLTDFVLFSVQASGLFLWIMVNAAHILTSRTMVGMWARPLQKAGSFKRRIAIVGGGEDAGQAMDALDNSHDIDVQIAGMYDDRTNDRSPPVVRGYRKLGNLAKLTEDVSKGEIDMVIIAIPMTAHIRLMYLLTKLWKLPVDVRVCGQAIDMKLSPSAYGYLGKLPLLTVFARPLAAQFNYLANVVGRVFAIVLFILLLPLFAVISLAVAASSKGSVFVMDDRAGFDNSPLKLFKFRTRHPADSDHRDAGKHTSVGKLLRHLHIARMPRLLNVILGDLALVGPAVHFKLADGDIGHYERVADAYCLRHKFKPGLTGWAQIHGMRGEIENPEAIENRVKYDLEYVDRASMLFDLSILFKTPFAWMRNERPAYSI